MQFLRKKALSLSALRAHQENHILLFHCSGLTSRQWRQIKNILCTIKGKTLFKPNLEKKNLKKKPNRDGPTCILYLTETPNTLITMKWSQLLPAQNLVLLYGQNGSLVFNHMEKATTLETSVFQQLLGFMFLPGACFLFLVEQIRFFGNNSVVIQNHPLDDAVI
nr:ribosomal protein L10 [Apopellia endiviifolia]WIA66529.1 ribosomal protein L10 [Apopellia endiviifolia]WIA66570.1 ribosomal protein L10 [Apopellia endiviifolia]